MSEQGSKAKKAGSAKKDGATRKEVAAGTKVAVGEASVDPQYVPRFKKRYNEVIRPQLMEQFGYRNVMQVPRIEKIVLNIGAGEAASDQKKLQSAVNDLTAIAGQKAVVTRAKKAIAGFKIRTGLPIGAKVTLRKDRMYEFLDRLVTTTRSPFLIFTAITAPPAPMR